jgi:hypothetical protein
MNDAAHLVSEFRKIASEPPLGECTEDYDAHGGDNPEFATQNGKMFIEIRRQMFRRSRCRAAPLDHVSQMRSADVERL